MAASQNPYDPPTAEGEKRPPSLSAGTYAPCPQCKQSDAKAITFTWWGGVLGPKLFTHVKCQGCGTAYNGKTGASNGTAIAIYMAVGFVILFVLMAIVGGGALFASLS